MGTYEGYLAERRFYEITEIINSSRFLKEGYYLCRTINGFEVSFMTRLSLLMEANFSLRRDTFLSNARS